MNAARVPDASKRAASEDSSPRETKRSRHETPTAITPYEPEGVVGRSKRTLRKTVTPSPATSVVDDDTLPLPPASLKQPPISSVTSTLTVKNNHPNADNVSESTEPDSSPPFSPHASNRRHLPPPLNALSPTPKSTRVSKTFGLFLVVVCVCAAAALLPRTTQIRTFNHIIPPKHAIDAKASDLSVTLESFLTNVTLREFLKDSEGFHLAMAPSFFGFFGYFGLLAAWDEGLAIEETKQSFLETDTIKSTAGASAGAMAAMLLAVGIAPGKAAEFCGTIDLPTFADPPGIGSFFKGDKFQQLMYDFMEEQLGKNHSMQMQDSKIPVAVTGFDLQTLSTLVMTKGCVARSARASATFPFLFQPVHWFDADIKGKDYVLIDGGVLDGDGLVGLSLMEPDKPNKRVVNVVVGNFGGVGNGVPPGPSEMPPGVSTSELLSISMRNLPACGPWAMENGARAVQAAKKAMLASLNLPLYRGKENGHYELHIDASSFAV